MPFYMQTETPQQFPSQLERRLKDIFYFFSVKFNFLKFNHEVISTAAVFYAKI